MGVGATSHDDGQISLEAERSVEDVDRWNDYVEAVVQVRLPRAERAE